MKIDAHVHSSGISKCSRVTCEEVVDNKIKEGYDGAVLTNHCQPWYYEEQDHKSFMKSFVKEYEENVDYARNRGFLLLFGIEVTIEDPHYSDWLLYGATPKFLYDSPCLYKLKQKELFELCEKNGVALVQAHPYRGGGQPMDKNYMHGMEINCTPCDAELCQKLLSEAKDRGVLVTCGTDYHGDERPIKGGIYLPKTIKDQVALAEYLLSARETYLFFGNENIVAPGLKRI